MTRSPPSLSMIRKASIKDYDTVFAMVKALNDEDGHPVSPTSAYALRQLLNDERLGQVFLIDAVMPQPDGSEVSAGDLAGYIALTYGFSIELGGVDVLVDELYILPEFRGSGLGTKALIAAEDWCRDQKFASMFLEVMTDNPAQAMYRRLGFSDRDSVFLGKVLQDSDD